MQRVSARDAMLEAVGGALGRVKPSMVPDVLPDKWKWYEQERKVDMANMGRKSDPRRARNIATTAGGMGVRTRGVASAPGAAIARGDFERMLARSAEIDVDEND